MQRFKQYDFVSKNTKYLVTYLPRGVYLRQRGLLCDETIEDIIIVFLLLN